jgi:uncharacterized protein (DUF697 family)
MLLLRVSAASRFGPLGSDPLVQHSLDEPDLASSLRQADLIIIALDGRTGFSARAREPLTRVFAMPIPQLVVVLYNETASTTAALPAHMRAVTLADPQQEEAQTTLARAVLERLPRELTMAAARRLPGLRASFATQLTQATSNANASYALASSLPQQIPFLSLPFAAADMLILTKNQALMVYRLALAHGAPADFQAHLREILPVVGGAYLWRQLARTLVGLIPGWGVVPKVSVAYAGTYTTGVVAVRWYATGEVIKGEQLRQLGAEALERAKAIATDLVASARERGSAVGNRAGALVQRARRALPGGRKTEQPPKE